MPQSCPENFPGEICETCESGHTVWSWSGLGPGCIVGHWALALLFVRETQKNKKMQIQNYIRQCVSIIIYIYLTDNTHKTQERGKTLQLKCN